MIHAEEDGEFEMDVFRRYALREITLYLLAVGYGAAQAEVTDLSDLKHAAWWAMGHGGSLWFCLEPRKTWDEKTIAITHGHLSSFGRWDRNGLLQVVSYSDAQKPYENWYEREKAQVLWNVVTALLPGTTWVNMLTDCCGPHRQYPGRSPDICRPVGDKWLCEKCEAQFMLPAEAQSMLRAGPVEKSEREKLTAALRWQVLERDGFICQACGATGANVKLHVDHKIPIAKGGKTTLDNLHVLCAPCNLGKRDKMPRQETLAQWGLAA